MRAQRREAPKFDIVPNAGIPIDSAQFSNNCISRNKSLRAHNNTLSKPSRPSNNGRRVYQLRK